MPSCQPSIRRFAIVSVSLNDRMRHAHRHPRSRWWQALCHDREQGLVSASIRSALTDIDVTPLKGMRAALIFDLVADEGGGSFNGGRWSPGLLFSVGSVASPVPAITQRIQPVLEEALKAALGQAPSQTPSAKP